MDEPPSEGGPILRTAGGAHDRGFPCPSGLTDTGFRPPRSNVQRPKQPLVADVDVWLDGGPGRGCSGGRADAYAQDLDLVVFGEQAPRMGRSIVARVQVCPRTGVELRADE